MNAQEFKIQLFKTRTQWRSGLRRRLEALGDGENGGVALYSTPVFSRWMQEIGADKRPGPLAVDACGRLYFLDLKTYKFYRFDPASRRLELIPYIGDKGEAPGMFRGPTRLAMARFTLWAADPDNRRVQGFARQNWQITRIIKKVKHPRDLALDSRGNLFVLDVPTTGSPQIHKYDRFGNVVSSSGHALLKKPVALAVGKNDRIYVIDEEANGFLVFTGAGGFVAVFGDFSKISRDFKPVEISADRLGNIFAADNHTRKIYQFDPDGSCVGALPDFSAKVLGLACDGKGNLYASTARGAAVFSAEKHFTKEQGFYYSPALDSGVSSCQWHRLALNADLPPGSLLDVFYFASDDADLKNRLDAVLSDAQKSTQEKADLIESAINWVGPVRNPHDMLFEKAHGRYLWLKLALATLDENVSPVVKEMRVFYPRLSYLRYLPAIYQEDAESKIFLEKFLSLFESPLHDLEAEISVLFKHFSPETAPKEFIDWLASWLNLALEEEWTEAKKRDLIENAAALYRRKGTPAGIEALVKFYCGDDCRPIIIEHAGNFSPMVLGRDFRLGFDSLLIQTPVRSLHLGRDAVVGRAALRRTGQNSEDIFSAFAHRFTILLDLPAQEFARSEKGLKRLLNEMIPAHTSFTLRNVREPRVGVDAYVDLNFRVTDPPPVRPGVSAVVGSAIVIMDGEPDTVGVVDQHALVGRQTRLI